MNAKYCVYVFLDPATNQPRYVGVGRWAGEPPWVDEWDNRGGTSPVSKWLATLPAAPPRDGSGLLETPMTYEAARSYAAQTRRGLNAELIPNRTYNATQRGGGKAKPILDPNGDMFPSLRAAARAYNVERTTIFYKLKNQKSGWRYVDDNEQAQHVAAKETNCCSLCHVHANRVPLLAGPRWASKAICKKCDGMIRKLEREGHLNPPALRQRADDLFAGTEGRRKVRLLKETRHGRPVWLSAVADLLEAAALCD